MLISRILRRKLPATKHDIDKLIMKITELTAALTSLNELAVAESAVLANIDANVARIVPGSGDVPPETEAALNTLTGSMRTSKAASDAIDTKVQALIPPTP